MSQAKSRQTQTREVKTLQAVIESLRKIGTVDYVQFLQSILDQACHLTGCKYGAISLLHPDSKSSIEHFLTFGISAELKIQMGELPKGRGILGDVMLSNSPINIANISQSARHSGFPKNHPKMTSFLGVPIQIRSQTVGSFYLADKLEAEVFTSEDELVITLLAQYAALAINEQRKSIEYIEREHKIEAMIQAAPVGVLFADTKTETIRFANSTARNLFGVGLSLPLQLYLCAEEFQIQHPNGRPYTKDELPSVRALNGESVTNEKFIIQRKDGRRIPVLVNSAPIRSDRQSILGAVVCVQDVSAQSELEHIREQFAAVVAHDLRNPIQAIVMQIEFLISSHQNLEETKVTVPIATLQKIHRSAMRLAHMANDLLDIARIDYSQVHLESKTIQLPELVVQLIDSLRPTLGDHPVEITVLKTPPACFIDPMRFAQILINLVENAAKYSESGKPIRIYVDEQRGGAQVSIQDQGIGIEEKDLPKLFDRYYQAKRSREHRSGLGLGLFITRGMVEAHGGTIQVESTIGKGSTFHLWFPAAKSKTNAA